jgi:TolB protein
MRRFIAASGVVAAMLAAAPAATAGTFPGANGRIAYAASAGGTSQVFTMNARGGDRRQITHESAGAAHPDWSPDGRSLAYDIGGTWIGVVGTNGDGRRVIQTEANAADPSWSPDGGRLVFQSNGYAPDGSVENASIYVVSADGTGLVRLGPGTEPVWSPDGSWIVFRSTPGDSDLCPGIYAMRPDANDRHGVAPAYRDGDACDGGGSDPSFSPNGHRVVFVAPNGRDLFTVSVDGGTDRRVRSDTQQKSSPVYSPDGREILYSTSAAQATTRIVRLSLRARPRTIAPSFGELSWQPLAG